MIKNLIKKLLITTLIISLALPSWPIPSLVAQAASPKHIDELQEETNLEDILITNEEQSEEVEEDEKSEAIDFATTSTSDFTYVLNRPAGIATITGYIGSSTEIEIPSQIIDGNNVFQVVNIYREAFAGGQLTSLVIPDTVTNIGVAAFADNQLTTVVLGNSVTTISASAFQNNLLVTLEIPNSVTQIGLEALKNNLLTTIYIPDSVTSIGKDAFRDNPLQTVYTDLEHASNLVALNSGTLNWIGTIPVGQNVTVAERLTSTDIDYDSEISLTNEVNVDSSITFSIDTPSLNPAYYVIALVGPYLTITSQGTSLTVQWYKDGVALLGQTGLQLALISIMKQDAGIYHAVINSILKLDDITLTVVDQNFFLYVLDGLTETATVSGFDWNYIADLELANVVVDTQNIIIPSIITINNVEHRVTTIGKYAFWYNSYHTWQIGRNPLTSVVLPHTLTDFEAYSFTANQLTQIEIPDSVTAIGWSSFRDNQLTSVDIPNSVTLIQGHAFGSNQLQNVELGEVIMIGRYAFSSNYLTQIEIPDSIITIDEGAFEFNQLAEITFPDSVSTIGNYAFYNNQLVNIELGNGVTTIGNYAFSDNQLTEVFIPNTVKSLGEFVFDQNPLAQIETDAGHGEYLVNKAFVQSFHPYSSINSIGWIGIPTLGVNEIILSEIGESVAYSSDVNLIAEKHIGSFAVFEISPLRYYEIDVYRYGYNCGYLILSNQVILTSITSIQWYKDDVALPGETNSHLVLRNLIEEDAGLYHAVVNGTIQLDYISLIVDGEPEATDQNFFSYSIDLIEGIATIEHFNWYYKWQQYDICWASFLSSTFWFEIDPCMYILEDLQEIVIPSSIIVDAEEYLVTTIGAGAFQGEDLLSVVIPDSVTEIEDYAFAFNPRLTNVIMMGNSVIHIGNNAFYNSHLFTAIIPDSVITIGDSAFITERLMMLDLGNSITEIGESAFESNLLISLEIPESVINIDDYAFAWNQLTHVILPNTVVLGSDVFLGNSWQPSRE